MVEAGGRGRLDLHHFVNFESKHTNLWCGLLIIWTQAEFQNLSFNSLISFRIFLNRLVTFSLQVEREKDWLRERIK